jgi:2,5-diketo-D-gluconate reductase A
MVTALLLAAAAASGQASSEGWPEAPQQRLPPAPTIQIAPGVSMPLVSLGTAEFSGAQLTNITREALALGYVGIDNDDGGRGVDMGVALRGVPRSKFFLTAKVNGGQTKAETTAELESEHAALGVGQGSDFQIDLILLHHPTPAPGLTLNETIQGQWAAIEDFYRTKRARAIGVSNFCPMAFAALFATATITPAVNQIMFHAGLA